MSTFFRLFARTPRILICCVPGLRRSGRRLNPQILRQISPGQRNRILHNLVVGPVGDQLAAILSRPRPKIENAIRRPHDVRIMLDHQNRIPQIAQVMKNFDQPVRIARCRPIEGSSSTYSVPTSRDPSEVAS